MFFRSSEREEYIVSSGLDDVGHVSLRSGTLLVEAGTNGDMRTVAVVHPEGCDDEFTSDGQRNENLQMAAQAFISSHSATRADHVNTVPETAVPDAAGSVFGTAETTTEAPVLQAPVVEVPRIEPVAASALEPVVVAPVVSAPAVEPGSERVPAANTHGLEEEPVVEEAVPPAKVAKGWSSKGKRGGKTARKSAPEPAVKPEPEPAGDPEDDGVLAEVEEIMQPDPNR